MNKAKVLLRMIKLVKPLTGCMILAVLFGTIGFLTAQFIPVLGGMIILNGTGEETALSLKMLIVLLLSFALLRAEDESLYCIHFAGNNKRQSV